ncbi:hypothetical protein EJ06DRAFT_529186 [Trichodelitschia bisporula]|uniref:Galactose oxidase n=1 Tax=Trichodelitschia bisporula TaxID=703511 RepID=A0A6G1I184_9PEZI|nr:hypothetical protein EJ06DRAFT_529186 [Trichodelitschia bisporula]
MKVLSLSLCIAMVSAWPWPLERRQANSAIGATAFRRRGGHSSTVLGKFVYIDGGEFSYKNIDANVTTQYSNTLIAIDLSKDWTNSTVTLQSISKPSGVPNLVSQGGLWTDAEQTTLYTGFGGRGSAFGDAKPQWHGLWSFKPDNSGSGTWTNMNDTATVFQSQNRPWNPAVTSGDGMGYALGGFGAVDGSNNGDAFKIPAPGLLVYNMTTHDLANKTVTPSVLSSGTIQGGALHFVPNFGPRGLLVQIGGEQVGAKSQFPDIGQVQVYDPASDSWYTQSTTGNMPSNRKEFCIAGVASTNETYEILVYGGWGGNLGARAIPYDEAYVLSLPGFNWFKAPYPASNPRHALTCHHVGGGQVLTIGGLNTAVEVKLYPYWEPFNLQDNFAQGLGVFDMKTMSWQSGYKADGGEYASPDVVQNFYSDNGPIPKALSQDLKTLFGIKRFSSATNATSSGTGPGTGSSGSKGGSGSSSNSNGGISESSSSSGLSPGAIAGIVVGVVLGLILLAALAFMMIRRRRARRVAGAGAAAPDGGPAYQGVVEAPGESAKYEMPGDGVVYAGAAPAKQRREGEFHELE